MPPVLDPSKSKVDGLAFLGLSLSRADPKGHPDSATHQTAFDLNEVIDRDYQFIMATNDDGWLVGGGEPGPPKSYKLAAKDSSHVEIMRIGTYNEEWGGVPQAEIIKAFEEGKILIPQIEVVPTGVMANPDKPPELEIRFDMEPEIPDFDNKFAPLPVNWQLRFLHNQLFKHFVFPSRFCPGAFHSTILRKAEFRSPEHQFDYFEKCARAILRWRAVGPQPLNCEDLSPDIVRVDTNNGGQNKSKSATKKVSTDDEMFLAPMSPSTKKDPFPESHHKSGLYLFTDRNNITHRFAPNFLPPYDTPEKRKIIMDVLREEWCEKTKTWKKCGEGSMTKIKPFPAISTMPARKAVAIVKNKPAPAPEDTATDRTADPEDSENLDSGCGLGNIIGAWN